MPEHKADTNKTTQIKLTSTLEQVVWSDGGAVPGATVMLEIYTGFVGNGAKLEITLSDHNGKKHGSFKQRIAGNKFWASIIVPETAEKALYAEVKLPDHGLSGKSDPLIVFPPIKLSNLAWDPKKAHRGDIVKMTASVSGAPDGTPATVAVLEEDADRVQHFVTNMNAVVQNKKIEVEWMFNYQDDTTQIPTADEVESGYHPPSFVFHVRIRGIGATSGPLAFKDWIELRLTDLSGDALAKTDFIFHFPDGSQKKGTSDENGMARVDDAPPGPVRIELPGQA